MKGSRTCQHPTATVALFLALAACDSPEAAIRVNLLGYHPDLPKAAVLCITAGGDLPDAYSVVDAATGDAALGPVAIQPAREFGPCAASARLAFDALRTPGRYRVVAGETESPEFIIGADVYRAVPDSLLYYLRQQRSGFNPLFADSVHHRTDAILVDHAREGEFIPVAGGWADAADYLQYATTSATTTFHLLKAWREAPEVFDDRFDADGLPGRNGVPDVLDEARHGLAWLLRMYPEDDLLLNQIGDDRDHAFLDLPTTDSSDYGWGRGGFRPVYPCTGAPQGLLGNRNRSDGKASAAGKFASAFALGALIFADRDPQWADTLAARAVAVYELGRQHPGVCQTAPARAPYFYEEANWVDDMALAAAMLYTLTREVVYFDHAREYIAAEPVTPWMGADTARHYEWFPWHNHAHHELWRATADPAVRYGLAAHYRAGLDAVSLRGDNAFLAGIPFIWCSNDLMVALATQALHWTRMTGESDYRAHAQAAFDWIFGANPWGKAFVVGLPDGPDSPQDPHSVVARELGVWTQTGGLVDGPVYHSIFENLQYVTLTDDDRYAAWNTGHIVYHDDWGDYSTNEPILDGTAALVYLAAIMATEDERRARMR